MNSSEMFSVILKAFLQSIEKTWKTEIIDCGMYDLEVGTGKTYADKEDFYETQLYEIFEDKTEKDREEIIKFVMDEFRKKSRKHTDILSETESTLANLIKNNLKIDLSKVNDEVRVDLIWKEDTIDWDAIDISDNLS